VTFCAVRLPLLCSPFLRFYCEGAAEFHPSLICPRLKTERNNGRRENGKLKTQKDYRS
jgi:hypothetical protein